jgi:hypothetical protein
MKISMEPKLDELVLISPPASQPADSRSEEINSDLTDDDRDPAESMDFSDDSDDGIDWECDEPKQSCGEDFPAEDGGDCRLSIYDRPVCGCFGRLYWLKIQLRIALLRVWDLIKAIRRDTEASSAPPDDFPL